MLRSVLLSMLLLCALAVPAPAQAVKVGDPAPDIKLVGTDGKMHGLRDAVGSSWTVIAWYPKAHTSGCTLECKMLTDEGAKLEKYRIVLYGASVDAPADNKSFQTRNKYGFVLLSDPEKKLAKALGVLNFLGLANRWTFVVDDKGIVRYIDKRVNPGSAADDLVKHLETLQAPRK